MDRRVDQAKIENDRPGLAAEPRKSKPEQISLPDRSRDLLAETHEAQAFGLAWD